MKLNPALKTFWKTKARIKVLYGGRASSKCMHPDTEIIMYDYSLKKIKDIKIGEQVMGVDGNPRNIIATATGIEKMYKVKQHFGDDYIVNASHILSLKKREGCKDDKGELCRSGNYRRPNGRYSHEPDILNINIEEYIKKSKRFKDNFRGYKSGLIEFLEADLPIEPYFLGLWLGDGDSMSPNITTADHEILEYTKSFAEKWGVKYTEKKDTRSRAIRLRLSHESKINPLWNALKDLGVATKVTRGEKYVSKKHIPLSYLKSSSEQRLELLAGLVDSDGTYTKDRNAINIIQKNKNISDGIKRLCNSLGFRTIQTAREVKFKDKKYTAYNVSISGEIWKIPCKVARKKPIKTELKKDFLVNVLQIEDLGIGEYAGITIDGDHLYLLADHTVTHNTHDASGMLVFLAQKYKIKVLCTRQFQNRITESVYVTLKNKIEEAGLQDRFTITNNRIVCDTGSEFIFYGLWRNIDEIKSLEGVDICYIEEAHSLTQEQWDILEPTIRKQGSEFWIVFNPRLRTDFVYKNFVINKQPNSIVRKINYDENPFLSATMTELIENKKKEDIDEFRHIYLGEPREEADNSLFNYAELEEAMDEIYDERLMQGIKVFGLDVARFGSDSTVLAYRRGLTIEKLQTRDKYSTTETASWIAGHSLHEETDAVIVDTVGVGGGVFDQLSKVGVFCIDGNAGMAADDPRYFNKRAEMYFNLKNALKIGLKLPKDDDLLEELMSITYSFSEKGQIKLQSKDKIKEELGRSPDRADAVALTFFTIIRPKEMETDEWRGGW